MSAFPCAGKDDDRPRLGLMGRPLDETCAQGFRRLFPLPVARRHLRRVRTVPAPTPDSTAMMEPTRHDAEPRHHARVAEEPTPGRTFGLTRGLPAQFLRRLQTFTLSQ